MIVRLCWDFQKALVGDVSPSLRGSLSPACVVSLAMAMAYSERVEAKREIKREPVEKGDDNFPADVLMHARRVVTQRDDTEANVVTPAATIAQHLLLSARNGIGGFYVEGPIEESPDRLFEVSVYDTRVDPKNMVFVNAEYLADESVRVVDVVQKYPPAE